MDDDADVLSLLSRTSMSVGAFGTIDAGCDAEQIRQTMESIDREMERYHLDM